MKGWYSRLLLALVVLALLMTPTAQMETDINEDNYDVEVVEKVGESEAEDVKEAPVPDGQTTAEGETTEDTSENTDAVSEAGDEDKADDTEVFSDMVDDEVTETTVDLSEDDLGVVYAAEASMGLLGADNQPVLYDIATTFDDSTFRTYVSTNFDLYTGEGNHKQGADGKLSEYEIGTVARVINLRSSAVASLEGIKSLTALDYLDCSGCASLTSLDVSGLTALRQLVCYDDALSGMNVAGCEGLQTIDCWNNTSLTTLDVSGLSALYHLDCSNCGLTSLTVSGCTALNYADIHDNALASVNMGDSPEILAVCVPDNKRVYYRNNNSETDAYMYFRDRDSGACLTLDYGTTIPPLNGLEMTPVPIDAAHFPDPVFRDYVAANFDRYKADGTAGADGSLCEKDMAEARQIIVYDVNNPTSGLGIKTLEGIKHFVMLESVDCSYNELETLDVSGMTSLKEVFCHHNKIKTLNLSGCKNLYIVDGYANAFTQLDISDCPTITAICKPEYVEVWGDGGGGPDKHTGYIKRRSGALSISVEYDYGVTLITEKAAPPPSGGGNGGGNTSGNGGSTDPGPEAVATTPEVIASAPVTAVTTVATAQVVSVTRAAAKATVSAAPGQTCQIDLGGEQGTKYKSSNRKVATVDQNGTITVRKAGKTKISCKVGKKKRTLTLTIKDPTVPTRVSINVPGSKAVKKGESQALTVTLPEGTDSPIKWKSSNKKVATVSSQGVVTFKKKGRVTITATAKRGKKKAKVKFTVSN